MPAHELSRDTWVAFFQTFTHDHLNSLTTMEVDEQRIIRKIAGIEAHELPLREIAADVKDRESTIVITLGSKDDESITHEVREVEHIQLDQNDSKLGATLTFTAKGGDKTTLKISAPTSKH